MPRSGGGRTAHREPAEAVLNRAFRQIRLAAGLGFILCFLALARPAVLSLALAVPLLAAGLALRGWAAGHLVKRKSLTRSGPYAHTRNPLYLGSLFLLLGACTAARSPILWAIFLPFYVVIHVLVIRGEQELAARTFPDEFAAYAASVPAFLPRLRPAHRAEGRFAWRQYLKNGEYNAGLGTLLAVAFLVLRLKGML